MLTRKGWIGRKTEKIEGEDEFIQSIKGEFITTEVLKGSDVARREKDLFPLFKGYVLTTGQGNKNRDVRDYMNAYTEKGIRIFLLKSEDTGRFIGFSTMHIKEEKGEKFAKLVESYLAPEYRKKGLGSRLNAKRLIYARLEGVPEKNIISGSVRTPDGGHLQKARPKIQGRIYGIDKAIFEKERAHPPAQGAAKKSEERIIVQQPNLYRRPTFSKRVMNKLRRGCRRR
ncbi:MAG: GNAT family N-acetyltransferase [Candidatus Micrarchaeota archaeon]